MFGQNTWGVVSLSFQLLDGLSFAATWHGLPSGKRLWGHPEVYDAGSIFGASPARAAMEGMKAALDALLYDPVLDHVGNIRARIGPRVVFVQRAGQSWPVCEAFGAEASCELAQQKRPDLPLSDFWRDVSDGHPLYASVKLPGNTSSAPKRTGNQSTLGAAEYLSAALGQMHVLVEDDISDGLFAGSAQVFLGAAGTQQWFHHDTSPGLFFQLSGTRRWDLLPPEAYQS